MSDRPLFREAAADQCRAKWLGEIVLVQPLSFWFMTAIAAAMALLIIGFFMFGQYTKRSTVSGHLIPDIGVLRVYSPQPGIVVRKLVREGQAIKKSDVLYVISSERQSNTTGGIQATVSQQVALRQRSLREEITHTRRLQQDQDHALRKKIDGLQAEESNIVRQIAGQRLRVALSESNVERASQLQAQGYVSAEMAQQKQADLLDQRNRLEALVRDQLATGRELQAQRSELAALPLRQHNEIAQLERLLVSMDQEWTESEGKRRITVVAPEDGVATAVAAEIGQAVDGLRPLVSVIPAGATLQAHLYAPSRAIGFVRPADKVMLRYQAYPYQKFGHAVGTVASVSRTAVPPNEAMGVQAASPNSEPIYLITVTLARQTIIAYGRPQTLQAGMLVDADILQEKRKLYEWILEPLYSLSGKL
jgi:membrane fusion protein